jgi:hypothetical protein
MASVASALLTLEINLAMVRDRGFDAGELARVEPPTTNWLLHQP